MINSSGLVRPRFELNPLRRVGRNAAAALLAVIALFCAACSSTPKSSSLPINIPVDVQTLSEGDTIKIAFPGTPSMREETQTIRRDGRINLPIIGEVRAIGKTPAELEKDLETAYTPQLISKEVKVTVVASAFSVYVGGAVMKAGKIMPPRAVTVLDAIMEAGGFDETRANKKAVRVIRQEGNQVKNYYVNMKALLEGVQSEPFYLQAYDVVYVPEKISWF